MTTMIVNYLRLHVTSLPAFASSFVPLGAGGKSLVCHSTRTVLSLVEGHQGSPEQGWLRMVDNKRLCVPSDNLNDDGNLNDAEAGQRPCIRDIVLPYKPPSTNWLLKSIKRWTPELMASQFNPIPSIKATLTRSSNGIFSHPTSSVKIRPVPQAITETVRTAEVVTFTGNPDDVDGSWFDKTSKM